VDKETGAARRFNPREFDCDAFVEIPSKMWMEELVEPGTILCSKVWAKITELREWKRAIPLRNIEDGICERLCSIDGR
jgi:hypothetical protein